MEREQQASASLRLPAMTLDIGITGHRSQHPVFSGNREAIAATLDILLDELAAAVNAASTGLVSNSPVRLHSLLASGADVLAARSARARGWPVVAPLPFGKALNLAVNGQPANLSDMEALLSGSTPLDSSVVHRAADIAAIMGEAQLFELAEQDEIVTDLFRAHLAHPDDHGAAIAYSSLTSDRAALAARVMIDHSDVVIGIWDGATRGTIGGTRHTIEAALDQGIPVVWINASEPAGWHILHAGEALATLATRGTGSRDVDGLKSLVKAALLPGDGQWDEFWRREKWPRKSRAFAQSYRRIEAVFGDPGRRPFRSLTQHYEAPEAIAEGSGAPMLAAARALPGGDATMAQRLAEDVLRPMAWADGVSNQLSDAYRGGMVASFFLSALAIVGGMAYLPFASVEQKWGFAAFEFLLLGTIVGIFFVGKRRRWHERWFATRRVAEYLRHAPIMLLLGAARSTGRWPRGVHGNWPETLVRRSLRAIGLPSMQMTAAYLRATLVLTRDHHVRPQRDYHRAKAARLRRAHHNLHRLSELLFVLAVLSVAGYLVVEAGAALGWLPTSWPVTSAKIFTFFGVLFPTLGGALAGVQYFGDFERFGGISEMTALKLDDIDARIALLLEAPDSALSYGGVAGLAHAIDEIVVGEIENWQSVFGGKHITVPV